MDITVIAFSTSRNAATATSNAKNAITVMSIAEE